MRKNILTSLLTTVVSLIAAAISPGEEPTAEFYFKAVNDQSRGLWQKDKPVLVYNYGPIAKPQTPGARSRASYVHPVYGLDGEVLSDDFPKDHLYHRGLFWAWPHVQIGGKEYDLWSARAELQDRFVCWTHEEVSNKGARLGVENGWFADGKKLVREEVSLFIYPASAVSRAIDVDLSWTPLEQPMTLWGAPGKSYGGINFRAAPRTKTIITTPEGRQAEDLLMTKLPWADMSGDFPGGSGFSGVAIFVPL